MAGIVSAEGPFRSKISEASGLVADFEPTTVRRSHTGSRDGGIATITATGVVNNAVSRSGASTVRVPVTSLNQALQRVNRLGGRVINVVVG